MRVYGTTRSGEECTLTTEHAAALGRLVLLVNDLAYKPDELLPSGARLYIHGPVHAEDPRRDGPEAFAAIQDWNVRVSQARTAPSGGSC